MRQETNDARVLCATLSHVQMELDARTNQLSSQCIAFEEEKLARENIDTLTTDGEAESLRKKLRVQVNIV